MSNVVSFTLDYNFIIRLMEKLITHNNSEGIYRNQMKYLIKLINDIHEHRISVIIWNLFNWQIFFKYFQSETMLFLFYLGKLLLIS